MPSCQIARLRRGEKEYVCTIAPREDGGVSIQDAHNLDDVEREQILRTFGSPAYGERSGVTPEDQVWTGAVTVQPGEPEHFLYAAYALPRNFSILRWVQ